MSPRIYSETEVDFPIVRMSPNQNGCDGAVSYDLLFPKSFGGQDWSFTLFQLVEDGKILLEVYLSRDSLFPGARVCVKREFSKMVRVFISYGVEECSAYKYGFSNQNFANMTEGEVKKFTQVGDRKNSCAK